MVRRIVHERSSCQDVSLVSLSIVRLARTSMEVNGSANFSRSSYCVSELEVSSLKFIYCKRSTPKDLTKERQTEISCARDVYLNVKN